MPRRARFLAPPLKHSIPPSERARRWHSSLIPMLAVALILWAPALALDFEFVYLDNAEADFASRGWLDAESDFQKNVRAAADHWGRVFDSDATIRVQVRANRNVARSGGTFSNGRLLGQDGNGLDIFEPGPLSRILTGLNPGAGPENIDIFLEINATFVDQSYWLDPTPDARDQVPLGKTDLVSIIMEELAHGFGIAGERSLTPGPGFGLPARGFVSLFDSMTNFAGDGNPTNVNGGPNPLLFGGGPTLSSQAYRDDVRLAHVGPNLLLSTQDFYHLGICGDRLQLTGSLISGCFVPTDGTRLSLTLLDIAIFGDLGYPLVPDARDVYAIDVMYPQLALGGGFEAFLSVSNTQETPWIGNALLNGGNWPSNEPWSLDGQDQTGNSQFPIELDPHESRTFQIGRSEGALSGWLEITTEGAQNRIVTSFFYKFSSAGELIDSTGVGGAAPLSRAQFPVESSGNVNTGIAIRRAIAPITFSAFDATGNLLESVTLPINRAQFINEIFQTLPDDFSGQVLADSAARFYAVLLRQELIPGDQLRFQLTSIPLTN